MPQHIDLALLFAILPAAGGACAFHLHDATFGLDRSAAAAEFKPSRTNGTSSNKCSDAMAAAVTRFHANTHTHTHAHLEGNISPFAIQVVAEIDGWWRPAPSCKPLVVRQGDFLRDWLPLAQTDWLITIGYELLSGEVGPEPPEYVYPRDTDGVCSVRRTVTTSPLAQALLAHPIPLRIVLLFDDCCRVTDWPTGSQHALYRTSWSKELHAAWTTTNSSLRDRPYGVFQGLHPDDLAEIRRGATLRADARTLLATFRGSNSAWYSPGERCKATAAVTAHRTVLDGIAARVMAGGPPLLPRVKGLSRIVFEMRMKENHPACPLPRDGSHVGTSYAGGAPSNWTYGELLTETVYAIVLPGDFWETYRLWEALEAGAIPIVQRIDGVYSGCDTPHAHVLATIDGILSVSDWGELPGLLEAEMERGWPAVLERQRRVLRSYAAMKARDPTAAGRAP